MGTRARAREPERMIKVLSDAPEKRYESITKVSEPAALQACWPVPRLCLIVQLLVRRPPCRSCRPCLSRTQQVKDSGLSALGSVLSHVGLQVEKSPVEQRARAYREPPQVLYRTVLVVAMHGITRSRPEAKSVP